MSTNLTTVDQLSSLASAIKNYADARGGSNALPVAGASTLGGVKIGAGLSMAGDTLSVNWASFSLGTLPATVEGAIWLENDA